jgi:signal transduction histidine kinase
VLPVRSPDSAASPDVENVEVHRAMLHAAGLAWELAIPLGLGEQTEGAEPVPDALLAVAGMHGRPLPPDPLALAAVLRGLIGGWRAASLAHQRAARAQERLEGAALAGRELAHALNNSLTMPVGVVELLLDRGVLSADLQEMIQAAASDLQALERQIRAFQELMRAQSDGGMHPGSALPP